MPSAQKPAGAEDAERALSREQPVAADAAAPTPANQGSASAAGAEFTDEDLQQDPLNPARTWGSMAHQPKTTVARKWWDESHRASRRAWHGGRAHPGPEIFPKETFV